MTVLVIELLQKMSVVLPFGSRTDYILWAIIIFTDCMELLLCTSHRAAACGTPAEGWVNSMVCLLLSVLLNKVKGIKSHFVWRCSLGRQLHNTFSCEILLILGSEHTGSAFGLKWPSAVRLSSSKILVVLLLVTTSRMGKKYFCWLLCDQDSTTSWRPAAVWKDGCTECFWPLKRIAWTDIIQE